MEDQKLAIFKGQKIRRTIYNNEWWFSIIDVIESLTGSGRPRKYWSDLKIKLIEEGHIQLSEKIGQLNMESSDGKDGGDVAGVAREKLEKGLGKSIVDPDNFLTEPESQKRLK